MKKTILEDGFPHAGKCLTDAQLPCTAKGVYESPVTTRTLVETEGSFCGSVIDPDNQNTQQGISIEEHGFANPEPDKEWDHDFSGQGWD